MTNEDTRNCAANGCFMPATLYLAGGPWCCIAHAGASRAEFDSITALMRNREQLFRAAMRMSAANYGKTLDDTQRKWLADQGHGWPAHGETTASIGRTLLQRLTREVRHPQKQIPQDLKRAQAGDFDPDV